MKSLADYQKYVESKRIIYINGGFSSLLVDEWREQRDKVVGQYPKGEIAIALNSIGGSITDALVIYHEIKAMAAVAERTVWLVCQGSIQSVTAYVSMAIDLQYRVAFPFTNFYLHRIKNYVEVEDDDGGTRQVSLTPQAVASNKYEALENEAAYRHSPILERQLRRLVVDGTKLNSDELAYLIDKNPHNFGVTDARQFGFISRVLK